MFPIKKLNDFITNSSNINQTGRIIIENNAFHFSKRLIFFSELQKMKI
jgi:hypothetical protein